MVGADSFSKDQVDVFDGVIARLAERIETKARAQLANRLAPVAKAPVTVVRALARDAAIEVAGPVLTQSPCLTEEDLLACAGSKSQDRLLAISKRARLSEAVGDLLVTEGNQDVVRSVARNEGARFSSAGYTRLVDRAVIDDDLAVSVGLRKDIPKEQFHALVSKASEVVFRKIAATNPNASASEVNRVLLQITGRKGGTGGSVKRDYTRAKAAFEELQRTGKPIESAVQIFASTGKVEETIVAISGLCRLPIESVDRIFSDAKTNDDLILLLVKAADLTWPTAKLILEMHRGEGGLSAPAINAARTNFERLQSGTAKRVVRFYQARQAAR